MFFFVVVVFVMKLDLEILYTSIDIDLYLIQAPSSPALWARCVIMYGNCCDCSNQHPMREEIGREDL